MVAVTKEPVALAPFAEQEQIVAEVEQRLSVLQVLDTTGAPPTSFGPIESAKKFWLWRFRAV